MCHATKMKFLLVGLLPLASSFLGAPRPRIGRRGAVAMGAMKKIAVGVVGPGLVGSEVLRQIEATRPLLEQQGLPKFDAIDTTHVKPAMDSVLAQLDAELASLEEQLAEGSADYGAVVEEMEKMELAAWMHLNHGDHAAKWAHQIDPEW